MNDLSTIPTPVRMSAQDMAELTGADLIAAVTDDPARALTVPAIFNAYYLALKAEAEKTPAKVDTEAQRDALTAAAFKLVKARTLLDGTGKKLNEDIKARAKVIDDLRKSAREKLGALEDTIRAPLTAWKTKQETIKAENDAAITFWRSCLVIGIDETAADIMSKLTKVRGVNDLSTERFGEWSTIAAADHAAAVAALTAAHGRVLQDEANRAELAAMRQKQADMQAELDRQAEVTRAEAVRQRQADEEADRTAKAVERAAEDAKRAAEKTAADALAEQKRAHDAALAKIEADHLAEARQVKDEADKAAAEKAREDAAALVRAKNQNHRASVNAKAAEAIMLTGLTADASKAVVIAIVQGRVPNVFITY